MKNFKLFGLTITTVSLLSLPALADATIHNLDTGETYSTEELREINEDDNEVTVINTDPTDDDDNISIYSSSPLNVEEIENNVSDTDINGNYEDAYQEVAPSGTGTVTE